VGARIGDSEEFLDGQRFQLELWDTGGKECYAPFLALYLRCCQGAFIVYDVTNRASFEAVPQFLALLREHSDPKCAYVLVGNKTDLPSPFAVSADEAEAFAQREAIAFIEISVQDGTNIRELSRLLIREWRRRPPDDEPPKKKSLFGFLRWTRGADAPVEGPAEGVPRPESIRRTSFPVAGRLIEQEAPSTRERALTLELQLSAAGMNQPMDFECESFRFLVNGQSYVCPRFQAMFVSPAVSNLVVMDRSVDEYIIENVSHPESFEMIMRLMSGGRVEVTDDNCGPLWEFAKSLHNSELESRLLELRPDCDGLNPGNAVDRLLEAAGRFESVEREIEVIALHFCEVMNIERLPLDILERVLENEHLRIESEDRLLDFVIGQMGGCQSLLRHIQCAWLSAEAIDVYGEHVEIDVLGPMIFRSVFCRLLGDSGTDVEGMTVTRSKAAVSSGGLAPDALHNGHSGWG
jgi:small GTP-binding protein